MTNQKDEAPMTIQVSEEILATAREWLDNWFGDDGYCLMRCETCANWKRQSPFSFVGQCSAEHRYSRVPMGDGSFAMLDSFGPTETMHNDACGAHKARIERTGA